MRDLQELTRHVCDIARQAGAYIRNEREGFSADKVERKHAHDYVSYVDKNSERLIVAALHALLPEAGFITEEGTAAAADGQSAASGTQQLWIVDPLDGTTNFIHGYAPYAVSIALAEGSTILVGVVLDVSSGECFYAWQGGGAYCENRDASGEVVSQTTLRVGSSSVSDSLLCLQLPYNSDAYKPVIQQLIGHFYGRAASIRMIGSAAIALCYVACGRLDGYAEQYLGRWDFMAGALIVREAGGTVTDYSGSSNLLAGNSVIAANPAVHAELLAACREAV